MAVHVVERCFYYCHCGIGRGTTFWIDARNASRPCGVNCSRPHSFRSACHAHQPLPLHRPRPARIDSSPARQSSRPPASSLAGRRDSSATCNWRSRVDASDGESGGRDVHCDGDKHARRAAAPSHWHSSFCYTCCPYAAYLTARRCVRQSFEPDTLRTGSMCSKMMNGGGWAQQLGWHACPRHTAHLCRRFPHCLRRFGAASSMPRWNLRSRQR